MTEIKKDPTPVLQTYRTNHPDIRAYGHVGGSVTLAISRHNDNGADFFLSVDAHLTPLMARELAGALTRAADFAEGVER